LTHPPHLSEWRLVNTSFMSSRMEAQGHIVQSTIHSPAWMDLVYRSRSCSLVSKKVLHTLQWDLLSMEVSQVEHTLKPYDTHLPPLNSHWVQDAPLNNLDEVHKIATNGFSFIDMRLRTTGSAVIWNSVHSRISIFRENEVSIGSL